MLELEFSQWMLQPGNIAGVITSQQITDIHLVEDTENITSFNCNIPKNTFTDIYTVHIDGSRIDCIEYDADICNYIIPKKTYLTVTDKFDNTIIFRGRIHTMEVSQAHNGMVSIVAADLRECLSESYIFYSPDDDEDVGSGSSRAIQDNTVGNVIQPMLENHNNFMIITNQCQDPDYPASQFVWPCFYGYTGAGSSSVMSEVFKEDMDIDGISTYEALKQIFEEFKYEWRIASQANKGITLEVAKKLGTASSTVIRTGFNLASISKSVSLDGQYTAIMPYGGFGSNEHQLTLSDDDYPCALKQGNSTVDTIVDQDTGARGKLYVENVNLVALYGLHIMVKSYDSVISNDDGDLAECRQKIVDKCKEDCKQLMNDVITFNISAYDLRKAGYNVEDIKVYNYYQVQDTITNINVLARCVKKDTDFDNPIASSMTFEVDLRDTNSTVE